MGRPCQNRLRGALRRGPDLKDFFISYTHADRKWAEWIAHVLQSDDHEVVIQSWDFGPGCNFVVEMHKALLECRRVVLVYSKEYFGSVFAQAEWVSAFAGDPTGKARTLLPVRVSPCQPGGLLRSIAYCDLVGLAELDARERLLLAARPPSRPRAGRSIFPGPGAGRTPPGRCDLARELGEVLATTLATFEAQCRIRDQLVAAMRTRLKVTERLEFEAFFHRYFRRMDDGERRQHSIIRGYTVQVLRGYNARALELARRLGGIEDEVPSLGDLNRHLTIWLSRYQSVIRSPSTCLVYVGVDEDAGFPKGVEDELQDYLELRCGARPSGRGRRRARARGLEG